MNIFLTGATGFVGKALLTELLSQGFDVVVAVRQVVPEFSENILQVVIGVWFKLENTQCLQDIDTVVHCTGRAHVTKNRVDHSLNEFREVNTLGTLNLARQSINAGVKRFIFISSIGVMGNSSSKPFTEFDTPNPQNAYEVSKFEAEKGLVELARASEMEVVIIRPPMVYGPNAPGNFARLVKWIKLVCHYHLVVLIIEGPLSR